MSRKILLMLCGLLLCGLGSATVASPDSQQAIPIPDGQPLMQPMPRAGCTMQKTNLVGAVYNDGFAAGDGIYTFYNPAVECAAAPYPYAITDFAFTLYDDGTGNNWPQTLDIVVYAMADINDSCAGLGAELCRFSFSPDQATFLYPSMGSYHFPVECCVEEPFYIGVEYPAATTAPVVSLVFDDQLVDICQSWGKIPQGFIYNWADYWTDPVPGWPLFVVGGETNAAACIPVSDCPVWVDGDPYKSENPPQLPDEAGWDVNATFPKVLADDFMCGETGYIKDIHFWGSWMDGIKGTVRSFTISFHSDIPASQSSTGYSMPGALLWEREITIFTETDISALTFEGWYDPYNGDVRANNHQAYMQYDICLTDQDWFPQERGTIYWLKISANVDQVPGTPDALWGWKSTEWHWNDDAVWWDCSSLSTCIVPDSTGTANLPADCPWVSFDLAQMQLFGNLPTGTTIDIDPTFMNFVNSSETTGGSMGGTIVISDVTCQMNMNGTGGLAGFSRVLLLSGQMEYHASPRTPGDPNQTIDIEIVSMDLTAVGDPDFCTIRFVAGVNYSLPSPGQTTLIAQGGNWQVDSFFDITYRIDWQGCPSSVLNGFNGSDQGAIRMGPQGSGTFACDWREMYEPDVLGPITNDFGVYVDPQGNVTDGFGSDAFGQGWYRYPSGWWNIWFYDHPFDPTRYKTMHVEFDIHPLDPTQAMSVEFALNWSTDTWSLDQPLADSSPPLPGVDENLYIGRTILPIPPNAEGHFIFDLDIPDYNPEWVSIDVRGFNFAIPAGFLTHQCVGQTQSMDLSFVITGDSLDVTGACCLQDGSCIDTDAGDCALQGGSYQGDGTDCASVDCPQPNNPPVAKCQDIVIAADANCVGCGSIDAGSYDPDGDPITSTVTPGCPYPLGVTVVELIVTDDKGLSDTCSATVTVVDITPPVAICPPDTTIVVPAGTAPVAVAFTYSATDNCPGVTVAATPPSGSMFPVGVTTVTVTATDAAGLTDICTFKVTVRETPPVFDCPPWAVGDDYKSENPPQLPDEAGWDVNATAPKTLADDFMCGQTGWIKDIHFWGSWLNGTAGNIRAFVISFHEDIPADLSPTGHSMPGKLLYERRIDIFDALPITGAFMEGWYDPWTTEVLANNHQEYWQYDICLDQDDWFRQEQGRIYWLNISAIVEEPVDGTAQPLWGWKSSKWHWNDDAVHLGSTGTTCIQPDSAGTIHMPPDCSLTGHYGEKMVIVEGLPQGSTIDVEIVALSLVGTPTERPGTEEGQSTAEADVQMQITMTGTGALAGFNRSLLIPGQMTMRVLRHPPEPGVPESIQSIQIEILSMDLTAIGDPDFDVLVIRAGSDNGLPSPGHTTLTAISSSDNWQVDSFFDITYSIDFQGAPGSQLDGMGGTTTGGPFRLGTEGTDSPDWREMYEPADILGPINNTFFVEVDENGNVVNGFGEGAYGDGWYHYPKDNWWNVWFYDHPFDYNRYKTVHIEFDVAPLVPGTASTLEFALNYSTDAWSLDQPPTDSAPPLPGTDEALYIQREILLVVSGPNGHHSFDFTIDQYNPEWVSIDIRGVNFVIDGFMVHECIGDGNGVSMDLAFVITGDTASAVTGGACCSGVAPNIICTQTDANGCAAIGGVYRGDGTDCATPGICKCCGLYTGGFTGNIDCDTLGKRNLTDITRLIDRVYVSKLALCCEENGDVFFEQGGRKTNLADITKLIDNVYVSKTETSPCQ